MRRVAIAIEDIASFSNLSAAAYRAARGKRDRGEVARFFAHFDRSITALSEDIRSGLVPSREYRSFRISDPKPRLIHAASFRDRVLHQAVMHYVGPVLDKGLLPTTFACREGMGHHRAELRRHPSVEV